MPKALFAFTGESFFRGDKNRCVQPDGDHRGNLDGSAFAEGDPQVNGNGAGFPDPAFPDGFSADVHDDLFLLTRAGRDIIAGKLRDGH